MKHLVNENLLNILKTILSEKKTVSEWAEIESDDMFQVDNYVGGYDADEEAFCFSYYTNGSEYWFQLTLKEVKDFVDGKLLEIDLEKADL